MRTKALWSPCWGPFVCPLWETTKSCGEDEADNVSDDEVWAYLSLRSQLKL